MSSEYTGLFPASVTANKKGATKRIKAPTPG